MEAGRCEEMVFESWHSHQCNRKSGHGKGGRYCKQHALRHPIGDTPTFVRWTVGKFDREPQRVECQSETDTTMVTIAGDRVKMNTYEFHTYKTFEEARQVMLSSARAKLDAAATAIDYLSSLKAPKE
jgi:hypothetical protein